MYNIFRTSEAQAVRNDIRKTNINRYKYLQARIFFFPLSYIVIVALVIL